MDIPKIICVIRAKNEGRWIKKVLDVASEICEGIIVLDDGSTDNTLEICKNHKNVLRVIHQDDIGVHASRDLSTIWEIALTYEPEFVLHLDGDEFLSPNYVEMLLDEITILHPNSDVFEFQALYVWDKFNQYRYDGIYSNVWAKKLLRIKNQPKKLSFIDNPLHSTVLPSNSIGTENSIRTNVKLYHYGYFDESLRKKKYTFYQKQDSGNKEFDNYQHLISDKGKLSGDHGIILKKIPEGMFYDDLK
jgi:glycosyltransferase involved in cell wall biosynthesis